MDNNYILTLKNITKEFPGVKALDDVTINIERGTIHGLVGENGAGKSTMLNIIGGLDTLDSGSLTVGGRTVSGLKQKELTEYRREDVGFIFQFYNLIPDLTAREYVDVVADIAPSPMNLDELWSVLPEEAQEQAKKDASKAPVIDLTQHGVFKLLGRGRIERPVVVKTKFISSIAEKKIKAAGGACILTA